MTTTQTPTPLLLFFAEIADAQLPLVGPKGMNLARMARVGLAVPPGFVITSGMSRLGDDPDSQNAIRAAYRKLGKGPVAVRSSALAEDTQGSSFAGQQETFLNVQGEDNLLEAVRKCWESIYSERAVAYRQAMGMGEDAVAMAVVVQAMAQADVAGVMFTRDPTGANAERMLIEGSWGLGEAIVSGLVTPDRWTLERGTGKVLDAALARKQVKIGPAGEEAVPADSQEKACLSEEQLGRLADLGRRVEAEYGAPQDMEWALVGNDFFLLQTRPITAGGADRESARQEEIAHLREIADPTGNVWARYSLAEVLPEPLPMTWAIWKQFMSGGGGYGRMYRELGFDPDPMLDTQSILDLIAGRPYFNLSRDVKLYFRNFPNDYPFEKLKANPEKAIYPVPEANLAKAPKGFLLKAFGVTRQMMAAEKTLERAAEEVDKSLEREHFPRIKEFAQTWRSKDLTRLSPQELLQAFEAGRKKLFDEFAPQSLKPSIMAGLAIQKLEGELKAAMSEAQAKANVDVLLSGTAPEREYDMAGGLRELSEGMLSREAFLERFGHRGSGEMELSSPRWRETPASLPVASKPNGNPNAAQGQNENAASGTAGIMPHVPPINPTPLESMLAGKKAKPQQAAAHLERARHYTKLREASKHCLMLGYEVLRLLLLELDRRHNLQGGVFYLEPEELNALVNGEDLRARISERRRKRSLALGLEAPRVLFSDDLDAIGRSQPPLDAQEALTGTGVSPGSAEGPALVLRSPDQAPPDIRDFILVCPSTDPGWVPLFLRARGVVLETGGVLSHGAIVAREFGLPAVANISEACARFKNGQILRVDGGEGKVWLLG